MKNKVDKVEGKGLSTNDYTNADKNKLSGIAEGAEVNVQADWNVSDSNSDAYIKNKPQAMKNPTSLNISLNGIPQGAYDGSSQKNVNVTAENVGADSSGTAETKVSEHNASEAAHADIRNLITTLTTRLNVLADSDDTTLDQLSEIVAYIKNNKSLIDSITTSKVNVSDIIDNLTSSAANKPLAAKQGKILKDLINTLSNTVEGKLNKSGDTMIGDLGISCTTPNISDVGTPIVGGVIICNDLTELQNYRGFLGTVSPDGNSDWSNVISGRHRNGHSDGHYYGMYLKCPINQNEDNSNLSWRYQNTKWYPERTLLDSYNYKKYCLSLLNEYLIAENNVCRISLLSKAGNTDRCGIEAYTKGNGRTGGLYFYNGNATLKSYNMFSIDVTEDVDVARAYYFDTDGLYPIIDHMDLGKSSFHWRNIYANNGTIQTSDRIKKKNIKSLDIKKIKSFVMGLMATSYEMVDGTSGRTHWGFIAQDIEKLMKKLCMDSKDFAGFIKSPKKIIKCVEYKDKNGNKVKKQIEEVIEGEYDYALRYDEFIAPIISVVQEQQRMIEQQQIAIENQQKEIEEIKKEISKVYSSM